VFVVAIYGGYFGAGIGILMISALSLLRMGDVHRVVPFKNLLAGCLRGVALVVLAIYGEIHSGYGIPMAVGGLIGGYLGGALTGRVNPTVLRGRRDYRVRVGSILLLDPLRPIGTTHRRRVIPTGLREAPNPLELSTSIKHSRTEVSRCSDPETARPEWTVTASST
jgi:hypothetical protein